MRKPYPRAILLLPIIICLISCKKGSESSNPPPPPSNEPPPFTMLFTWRTIATFEDKIVSINGYAPSKYTAIKPANPTVTKPTYYSPKWGKNNKIYFLGVHEMNMPYLTPYYMNEDGTGVTPLNTDWMMNYMSINISSLSGRIIFERENKNAHQYELVSMNYDGSSEKVIQILSTSQEYGFANASWYPDGETIIYSVDDDPSALKNMNLYSIKYDGTGKKKITSSSGLEYVFPMVSPDGKKLAFMRQNDIYTMNIDLTNERKILSFSPGSFFNQNVRWCSDSRWIACRRNQEMFFVDSETSNTLSKLIVGSADFGSGDVK